MRAYARRLGQLLADVAEQVGQDLLLATLDMTIIKHSLVDDLGLKEIKFMINQEVGLLFMRTVNLKQKDSFRLVAKTHYSNILLTIPSMMFTFAL